MIKLATIALAGALALSGCASGINVLDGNPVTVEDVAKDKACADAIKNTFTPAQLGTRDALVLGNTICEFLIEEQAVEPVSEVPVSQEEELVRRTSQAVYNEMVRDFPDLPNHELVIFDQPSTDAKACGPNSITSISACAMEVFFRIRQLFSYTNAIDAALYASPHEWAHFLQHFLGLLADYSEHQAFRELQADCIAGHYFMRLGPTERQVERQIILMTDIGDLDTHGTAVQRVDFWLHGFNNGVQACLLLKPNES